MEDITFSDSENFSTGKQDNFSYKIIVLQQLKKVCDLSSREFSGGYWVKKPHSVNGVMMMSETYVSDSRQEFCNAVNILSSLLIPKYDKEMQNDVKLIQKRLTELHNSCKKMEEQGVDEESIEENYWMSKIAISFEMFNSLLKLLGRKNFLDEKGYEG